MDLIPRQSSSAPIPKVPAMERVEETIAKHRVAIFSKSYCPYCTKVKQLFESLDVAFFALELDLLGEEGVDIQHALFRKTEQKSVPNVFIRGNHIGGCDSTLKAYNDGRLINLLEGTSVAYDYDLVVIGGGSGGLAASKEAAALGRKVAVCDFVVPTPMGTTWGLGGTCVNVGCIPKKLMHQAALVGTNIKEGQMFGWKVPEIVEHDWSKMVEEIQQYIKSLNWGYRVALKDKGVTYLNALAEIIDPHRIRTKDKKGVLKDITTRHIIIAVGGRPMYPNIPGAKEFGITSDDIFSLSRSPGKTLLVGASYIALECAGFLAGLGLDVTVMVRSILLRGFDQQMANKIGEHMKKHGVKFIEGCVPTGIEELQFQAIEVEMDTTECNEVVHYDADGNPIESVQSMDAVEASDAGKSGESVNSGEAVQLVELIQSGETVEPALSGDAFKSAEAVHSGEGVKSAEEVRSGEGVKSAEAFRSGEAIRSAEGVRFGEGVKSAEGVRSGEGVKTAEAVRSSEGDKSAEEIRSGEGVKFAEEVRSSEGVKSAEGVRSGEGVKSAEGVRSNEGDKSAEGVRSSEGVKSAEGVRSGEGVKSAEGVRSGEGVKSSEAVRSGEAIRSVEAVKSASGRSVNSAEAVKSGGTDQSEVFDRSLPLYKVTGTRTDGSEYSERFNTIVFAIGREACTKDLGLVSAEVVYDKRNGKIIVDEKEQTSAKNIFAIGDVLSGKPELTPVAIQAGKLLAHRMYNNRHALMDYLNIPTTVFTPLEYGCVGYSEEAAIEEYGEDNIEVYHSSFQPLEYALAGRDPTSCYAKLICVRSEEDMVVGFHYLGPNAGEITQGFAIGIKLKAKKADFAGLVGIHPTCAEIFTTMSITKASGQSVEKTAC